MYGGYLWLYGIVFEKCVVIGLDRIPVVAIFCFIVFGAQTELFWGDLKIGQNDRLKFMGWYMITVFLRIIGVFSGKNGLLVWAS